MEASPTSTNNRSVRPRGLSVAANSLSAFAMLASVLLMLYGLHRNPSIFLLCLFVIWVSSPFAAMLLLNHLAQRWRNFPYTTLHVVMVIVAVCSVATYASHIISPLSAKFGFPFIVLPFVSWLFVAVVIGTATALGRRG